MRRVMGVRFAGVDVEGADRLAGTPNVLVWGRAERCATTSSAALGLPAVAVTSPGRTAPKSRALSTPRFGFE
jgi:hypothetical protein